MGAIHHPEWRLPTSHELVARTARDELEGVPSQGGLRGIGRRKHMRKCVRVQNRLSMQAATHGGGHNYSCVTAGGCLLGGEGNKGNSVVLCIFIMLRSCEKDACLGWLTKA